MTLLRSSRWRATALIGAVIGIAALASCRASAPRELTVVGTDYAFVMPDSLPEGPAVIHFENRGRVKHEMLLVRIRDDVSNAAFADSLFRDGSTRALRAAGSGVLFAGPGERNDVVRLRMQFVRGQRYAFWCQFRDSATAPKHQRLGMVKLVTVQ